MRWLLYLLWIGGERYEGKFLGWNYCMGKGNKVDIIVCVSGVVCVCAVKKRFV